jgi:hypothetical protein
MARPVEKFDYEIKLSILEQYNEIGFKISDDVYITKLDDFIHLLFKLNNVRERERYVRKFYNLLDKFTKEHKLHREGNDIETETKTNHDN